MVSSDGVSDKGELCTTNDFQEQERIKLWEVTLIRLPFPIQEISIFSSIFEAVLGIGYRKAAGAVVEWPSEVWHPVALKQVTIITLTSDDHCVPVRKRRRKGAFGNWA